MGPLFFRGRKDYTSRIASTCIEYYHRVLLPAAVIQAPALSFAASPPSLFLLSSSICGRRLSKGRRTTRGKGPVRAIVLILLRTIPANPVVLNSEYTFAMLLGSTSSFAAARTESILNTALAGLYTMREWLCKKPVYPHSSSMVYRLASQLGATS